MADDFEDSLSRIRAIGENIRRMIGDAPETIDDFIYTEQQEYSWLDSERVSGANFTKRIATPLPTKRRRRVTVARVTSSLRLLHFRFLL